MGFDPAGKVGCHADVQRAVLAAREDVDARVLGHWPRLMDSRLRGNDGKSAGMTRDV